MHTVGVTTAKAPEPPKRRRRLKGEGTVWFNAKGGRWVAAVGIRGTRRSFYGKTQAEALHKLKAAIRAGDAGTYSAPSKQTVGAFLEEWLTDLDVRQSTREFYETTCRSHLAPSALGRLRLDQMTQRDVDAFVKAKLTGPPPLAPRTVAHMRAVLRTALAQAVRWDRVPRNVVSLSAPVKVKSTQVVPFSAAEARAILAAAAGDRLEALYVVALSTGMRQGEILGLHWKDVDLDGGTLRVLHGLRRLRTRAGGISALVVTDVKTDRSRRTVRLDPRVVAALRRHQVRQETRTQLLAGAKWRDTGLVFTTTYGTALGASNMVRSGWRGILKRAEVPYRPFHTSRHSAASFMIAAGVPIRTVMGQLGHSQMQMTSDLYTHLTAAMEVDAATRVADMLFPDRAQ
jgi:integrase